MWYRRALCGWSGYTRSCPGSEGDLLHDERAFHSCLVMSFGVTGHLEGAFAAGGELELRLPARLHFHLEPPRAGHGADPFELRFHLSNLLEVAVGLHVLLPVRHFGFGSDVHRELVLERSFVCQHDLR